MLIFDELPTGFERILVNNNGEYLAQKLFFLAQKTALKEEVLYIVKECGRCSSHDTLVAGELFSNSQFAKKKAQRSYYSQAQAFQ